MSTILENSKQNSKLDRNIRLFLYGLPLIFLDRFGILFIISAIAITTLSHDNIYDNIYEDRKRTSDFVSFLAALFITITISFLAYFNKLDNGFDIFGIFHVNSITVFFYILFPIGWFAFRDRLILKSFYKIDKKIFLHTLIICLPIIITNVLIVLLYPSGEPKNVLIQNAFQFVFMAGVAEELFYRGFIYNQLKRLCHLNIAVLVSALIFSVIHFNVVGPIVISLNLNSIANLFAIFMLGVSCALIYEKTKSLIPVIVFHALIDGALKNILLLISQSI